MNFMSIAKGVVGGVISYGINNIIGNIIKATTPENINTINKLSIGISAFALSSMISDKTTEYIFEEIDKIIPLKTEEDLESILVDPITPEDVA